MGDGPEKDFLQDLINTNKLSQAVQIVGWKNQQEVAEYMRKSDVFVFPTIREVGGNVIIEAMASGLPVVVPDYGGPSELVNEELGFKIALANKNEFLLSYIEIMEKLAKDCFLREKMSNAARNFIIENYSWSSKANRLVEIYDNC